MDTLQSIKYIIRVKHQKISKLNVYEVSNASGGRCTNCMNGVCFPITYEFC